MSRVASVLIVACLLLCFTVTFAARPGPALTDATLVKTQQHDVETQQVEIEESCGGVGKELEDCLMRRTLVAHLDYIYTQNNKH